MSEPEQHAQRTEEQDGGETACALHRVCDACGALEDGPPLAVCCRCGATRAD
jgi:hypothetical protein